jgi:hypothetical protein
MRNAFVSDLVKRARWANEIHIVLDNLSAHETKAVQQFLADHRKCGFTSLRPTPRGSTRWSCGLPRFSAICSREESLVLSLISVAKSGDTSEPTPKLPSLSVTLTQIRGAELLLTQSLGRLTRNMNRGSHHHAPRPEFTSWFVASWKVSAMLDYLPVVAMCREMANAGSARIIKQYTVTVDLSGLLDAKVCGFTRAVRILLSVTFPFRGAVLYSVHKVRRRRFLFGSEPGSFFAVVQCAAYSNVTAATWIRANKCRTAVGRERPKTIFMQHWGVLSSPARRPVLREARRASARSQISDLRP